MIELCVNIYHVATLRQARGTIYPDPITAALIAESAGADAITLHLREDRRHIQDRDVEILRARLTTRMNLESAVTDEMIAIALKIKPEDMCLVPERREELTTEGGLDVIKHFDQIKRACQRLADAGIRVSLFINADPLQIEAAARARNSHRQLRGCCDDGCARRAVPCSAKSCSNRYSLWAQSECGPWLAL